MEQDFIQEMRNQHLDNYRKAILEIIQNNTNVLMDDIISLIQKPPLDSMDSIRNKLLDSAKKNKIILNTEKLDDLLQEYRDLLNVCCSKIQSLRLNSLVSKVNHFSFVDDLDVFVLYKKDFSSINKDIKKIIKEQMNYSFEEVILKKYSSIIQGSIEEDMREKLIQEITNYFKNHYQKQLLDGIDIKILVKDTTLMNSIKEQSDRYLFTLNNSRLLNEFE